MTRRKLHIGLVLLLVAAISPVGLAGKPGGGGSPPDPAIACAQQQTKGNVTDRDLVVMNANGTNRRTLVDGTTQQMSGPDWSPDGTQLAFLGDAQGPGVYVVNVDGTGLRKVTAVSALSSSWWARPAWSPAATADGESKIAFIDNPASGLSAAVFVVNLDGTGRVQLSDSAPAPSLGMGARAVTWSPAADRIAVGTYTAQDGSVQDVVVHELGLVDGALAVTSSLNLTDDASVPGGALNASNVHDPSWSRTGDRLAVEAQYNTWVIDLADPASPVRVSPSTTLDQTDPCWSPDDGRLVVEQWHSARCLFTMNADGTGLAEIAHGKSPNGPGFFSPSWRRNP